MRNRNQDITVTMLSIRTTNKSLRQVSTKPAWTDKTYTRKKLRALSAITFVRFFLLTKHSIGKMFKFLG